MTSPSATDFFLLGVTLVVWSFGPGLAVAKRLGLPPAERLAATIGLSWLIVFLASWLIYMFELPLAMHVGVSLGAATSLVACRREVVTMLRSHAVRRILIAGFSVVAWTITLLILIRNYSGGYWAGDWVEHYKRAEFFLDRPDPRAARFLGNTYLLTARPPLMNVASAAVMSQTVRSFASYQIIFSFLNSLVVVPAALLMPMLGRRGSASIGLLACLFVLNPMIAQNATFAWTKLFAAFYALLGTALYLRGLGRPGGDPVRLTLAATFLATGVLVHYSAAVVAAVVAVHAAGVIINIAIRDRGVPWPVVESASGAAVAGLLVLGCWFVWSVGIFGVADTFAANTTVIDTARLSPSANLLKILLNLRDTIVPSVLRPVPPSVASWRDQPNLLGWWRDCWFLGYQLTIPMAIGLTAGLVAASVYALAVLQWLAGGQQTLPHEQPARRRFWVWFVPAVFVLGVAAHGGRDELGLAHIALQPLVLCGLATVAAGFGRFPPAVRVFLVAGGAIDLVAGVLLQVWVESLELQGFPVLLPDGSRVPGNSIGLGVTAGMNWFAKHRGGYVFVGDLVPSSPFLFAAAVIGGLWSLASLGRSAGLSFPKKAMTYRT